MRRKISKRTVSTTKGIKKRRAKTANPFHFLSRPEATREGARWTRIKKPALKIKRRKR